MKTILILLVDTTKVAPLESSNSIWTSFWFWIALAELAVIIFLLIRQKNKNSTLAFSDLGKDTVKNSKVANIDMNNLMNSINGSAKLYKEISQKCHPDRFVDSPKQKLAEEIFQEISKNKRNFEKLSSLKQRATDELNINFKQ